MRAVSMATTTSKKNTAPDNGSCLWPSRKRKLTRGIRRKGEAPANDLRNKCRHLHVRARSFKYGRRPPCLFNTRPFITHMTILVDGRRIARISICTRDLICEYSWVYARVQEERSKMRSRGSNHQWRFRGCWMEENGQNHDFIANLYRETFIAKHEDIFSRNIIIIDKCLCLVWFYFCKLLLYINYLLVCMQEKMLFEKIFSLLMLKWFYFLFNVYDDNDESLSAWQNHK